MLSQYLPQARTWQCSKCQWRHTATLGSVSPVQYHYCPHCGSPVASRQSTTLDHVLDALPTAVVLGIGFSAMSALRKLAGKKGD